MKVNETPPATPPTTSSTTPPARQNASASANTGQTAPSADKHSADTQLKGESGKTEQTPHQQTATQQKPAQQLQQQPVQQAATQPPSPAARDPAVALTAVQLLDSLQIRAGDPLIAQVTAKLENSAAGHSLLLNLLGRSLAVTSEAALQPGDLIRVQRAGAQLQLLETLSGVAPPRLTQALARLLPWQFRLDQGLTQLLRNLTPAPASITPPQVQAAAGTSQALASSTITNPSAPPATALSLETRIAALLTAVGATPPTVAAATTPAPGNTSTNQTPVNTTGQTSHPTALAVSHALSQTLQQLQSMIPTEKTLQALDGSAPSAALIKNWIEQSGHANESQLLRLLGVDPAAPGKPPLADNLKTALTRLLVGLQSNLPASDLAMSKRQTPLLSPELLLTSLQFPQQLPPAPPAESQTQATVGHMLRLLAGMLNRISATQVHAASISPGGTDNPNAVPTLLLELPWVNAQGQVRTLQARIEKRESETSDEKKRKAKMRQWRLSLAFSLDAAGPLYVEMTLSNRQLQTDIWAERPATLRQVKAESQNLHARLTALGLEVTSIDCHQGQPKAAQTRLEQRLVDIKA